MPAHVHIDAADIIRFKRQLDIERNALKDEMNAELFQDEHGQDHHQVIDSVRDRGDEAVADLYADLALASIQSHVDRLQAIENALYRINKNIYGLCLDCAKAISKARLDADPAVPRCIECQTLIESRPSAKDVTPSL